MVPGIFSDRIKNGRNYKWINFNAIKSIINYMQLFQSKIYYPYIKLIDLGTPDYNYNLFLASGLDITDDTKFNSIDSYPPDGTKTSDTSHKFQYTFNNTGDYTLKGKLTDSCKVGAKISNCYMNITVVPFTELVNNSGFESGKVNYWPQYTTGTLQKYTYPEPGRTVARYSAGIEYITRETGKLASYVQNISVDLLKQYLLSGWMKTSNILTTNANAGARLQIFWHDNTGKYLSTSSFMTYQTGTMDWTYFSGMVTPNPKASNATVCLILYDCSGKVWFDDISFGGI
jgi:hypothetical protein